MESNVWMSRSFHLLLVLVCSLASLASARHAYGPKCCPPNEVLLWCPPVCEPTCDNDCVPTPSGVPMETCVCKPGFVRHQGRCIEKCECPAPCPPPTEPPTECPPVEMTPKPCGRTFYGVSRNEDVVPSSFKPGPYFQQTAQYSSQPRPFVHPNPYSMMSQSQNLSQSSNYLYRPVRPCPPKRDPPTTVSPFDVCPPNEIQQPSPICCEETCTTNCAAVLCPAQPPTGPLVCTCDSGFVRHEGRCIKREECPVQEPVKVCGPNARYSPCTPCCQPTCDNDCSKIFCIAACTGPPTCVCNEGYVLHKGRCILPSECPGKCPPATEAPPRPCHYPESVPRKCPPPTTAAPPCQVHHYTESPRKCPAATPAPSYGSVYYPQRTCPPACPPGASLRPFKPCCVDTCTTDCRVVRCAESYTGPPTCVCEYGLVMHKNRCIPREHCPSTSEPTYGGGGGSYANTYPFLMD
ncbi:zonadhesin [Anopheles gambiae]|uniref:EGF-like domain-containing protein n=1 Tax=Anopheles coluzzii TaxID=1518534 RepID=A0A6E8VPV5_ANOCL|nr:zonadhesin [Anopheles gambiae]